MEEYSHTVIALIARVFLGMLFFFQGYDKVFNVKISGVVGTFDSSYNKTGLPKSFLWAGAYVTSYLELVGGLMLILGLFKYAALYLLGFDLLLAAVGLSILSPMWELKHAFPRLILLLIVLALPPNWDLWSVDQLLFGN